MSSAGWRDSTLGHEISLLYGKSLPAAVRSPGEVQVYGSNGCVGTHSIAAVRGPGIIVGRKGSVGEIVFSQNDFWPIDTTYYVENKRTNNWQFLYYLLLTTGLKGLNSHSAVPGLNRESAYPLPCSIPSTSEQEKIAAVLWKLQRAIATQDRLIAAIRDLKQSAMQRLFTHGMRGESLKETEIGLMPESWNPTSIGDIAFVSSGGTPSRANPAYWLNGTIPWVKTGEVDYCVINDTEEKITPQGLQDSAAKILPKGTLLLAMYGQGITRGKAAILGIDASVNQACAAIRPRDDRTDPDFLYYVLTHGYERLRGLAHGGQQQNLNADLIRGFSFGLPTDTDEQRDIAAALATLDRKLAHHQHKRAALNDLFQTMLHQLMTAQIRVVDLDIDTSEVAARAG